MNKCAPGVLPALICIACALILMSCTGEATDNPKKEQDIPQELTIARIGDVGTLNPHRFDSDMGAQTLLYEPLVNLDQDGNIVPWLAVSWEFEYGGRDLVFHLRKDVYFADGYTFDAQAVKQNFDAILADITHFSWLPLIDNLESVEVRTSHIVVLHFKAPYPFALLELTLVRPIRFLSPGGFGPNDVSFALPVGTGPYTLEEYIKDERAVFKRNENYWGKKPGLTKVTIRPVPDSNVRLNALLAGEVDLIAGSGMTAVSYLDLKNMESHSHLTTRMEMGDCAQFLVLNPSARFLAERLVRQAVALTVDTEEIAAVAFEGMEHISNTLFSTKVPEVLGRTKPPERNPQKAAVLLESAGFKDRNGDGFLDRNGEMLSLSFNYRSDMITQKALAEVVQSQLARLGIQVVIRPAEPALYYDRRKSGDFGMMPDISWGIQYDPQNIFKSFRDGRRCLAPAFEGEAGVLLKRAIRNMDVETRRRQFDRIADIFMNEEFIVIPLTVPPNVAIFNKRVRGFAFSSNVWELCRGLTDVAIVE
jgi:nickel transport system substrate-binding protein